MILRTVHVGVGGNGQWSTEVLGADPRFRPVAIIDTHATSAKTAQYKLGLAGHKNVPTFSGLTGALTQIEADALVVTTPTKTHAEFVRMALAVNMHVLVERPLTISWDDAKAIVADADSAWVKLCVAQRARYTACEQTVAYILSKPDHPYSPGAVRIVDYVHHRHRPEPGKLDFPFAMVWDAAVDHVDSLATWLGPVKRVTARSYATPWTHYTYDANLSAFIEFEGGAVCNYVMTHDANIHQQQVTMQGERGALVLTDQEKLRFFPKPAGPLESAAEQVVECDIMDCVPPEQCIADEFFRYVVEDVEPGISGKRNLQTVAVCEALVRSAREKKPIDVSDIRQSGLCPPFQGEKG